jgi:hypothetical protein
VVGCGRPTDLSLVQERAQELSAEIGPGGCVGQVIVPGHDDLVAIEVLLDLPAEPRAVPIRLRLSDEPPGRERATASAVPAAGFATFDLPPQTDVRGRRLSFCLDADAPSGARAWYAADLARPDEPRLEHGRPVDGTLTFRARYRAWPLTILRDAGETVARHGRAVAALFFVLLAPGLLLGGLAAARARLGLVDALAAAPGAGVLALTLGWWLAYLGRVPITAALLTGAASLCLAVAVALAAGRAPPSSSWRDVGWLLLIWLLTLVVRLAVVRDLALPAWVDAPQHAYIAGLIAADGRLPDDYGRLIGFGPFSYHFGFHTLAATVALLTGDQPADAVLVAGQLLSAAAAPTAFLLARLFGGSVAAGLGAAAVAGLVSFMPAYYVSWSRFTQLAGLVALPAWLLLLRGLVRGPGWALLGGLASLALLFVHPRVAVMAGALLLVDLVVCRSEWRARWRWRWPAFGVAAAVAVGAPWLLRVGGGLVPRLAGGADASLAGTLDAAALSIGYDPWLYGLAAAVAVAGALTGHPGAIAATAWAVLLALAVAGERLGLPGGSLLGAGSVLISLWLPAAALVGGGIAAAFDAATGRAPRDWRARLAGLTAPAVILAGLALSRPTVESLNPSLVLATARDRSALARLSAIVAPDALVAVNVRDWQFGIYAGADAGYWVGIASSGRAIVPPVLYALAPIDDFRAASARIGRFAAAGGDPARIASEMRRLGAEWLFVGERGGAIDARGLTPAAGFELVLADGGARLYRLRPDQP